MKNKVISLIVLFHLLIPQAFAVCDQEKSEYEDWNSKCENLCASSQITGAAGGIFAIATFGLTLVPCLALSAVAQNACRIRDEKKNNLIQCENFHADNIRKAEAEKVERSIKIDRINEIYSKKIAELTQIYSEKFRYIAEAYLAEQWDPDSAEIKEYLRQVQINLEKERDARIDQLDHERKNAIESV